MLFNQLHLNLPERFIQILTARFSQFAFFPEYLPKLINFASLYEILRRFISVCFIGKLWWY